MPSPFIGIILSKSDSNPKRKEKHSTKTETFAYLKIKHSPRDTVNI